MNWISLPFVSNYLFSIIKKAYSLKYDTIFSPVEERRSLIYFWGILKGEFLNYLDLEIIVESD